LILADTNLFELLFLTKIAGGIAFFTKQFGNEPFIIWRTLTGSGSAFAPMERIKKNNEAQPANCNDFITEIPCSFCW
jgi:hypothetical protein